MEYRPLEGFVFAVTPFNFTAIASNLVLAPVLMGNTVLWKPAGTSLLSSYYLMKIYGEGRPSRRGGELPSRFGRDDQPSSDETPGPGGNTLHRVHGRVLEAVDAVRGKPAELPVLPAARRGDGREEFSRRPSICRRGRRRYRHGSGAFEYQGQKCSAVSRCYIPKSLREKILSLADG